MTKKIQKSSKYELTKKIQDSNLEDLIEILENLNSKLNSDETNLEESIEIFEFAKNIEKLVFKKLEEIEFKFKEIMIDEQNDLEL